MKPWVRAALNVIRTLHVYASLVALILLLFFTVTGWLMAHAEALGLDRIRTRNSTLPLPTSLAPADLEPYLRKAAGIRGRLVSVEEEGLMHFRRAGGATLVEIDREQAALRITDESHGLSGRLFDLHRARSGPFSAWVLNLTAILFVGVSLSGLFLWLPLPKRRVLGLLALSVGLGAMLLWIACA